MYKIFFIIISFSLIVQAQEGAVSITRLKYNGGGDWYNDPSAEVNLLKFVEANSNIKVKAEYNFVDISTDEIFAHPFLFMTGHGNVVFTNDEAARLRKYLENGGFLYIDDDYGLNNALHREMKKVFPEKSFVELPYNYGLYNVLFKFPAGPPKTHKHDDKPPQGFGIFIDNRLVVFYTFESNPSDGWVDPDVHKDPEEKRQEALRLGANIVLWSLTQ